MKKYFKLLRVKNYIKNILILLPAVFSKKLLDVSVLPEIFFGVASFCALSSAVYIFNDLCDYNRDKLHPGKCNRPIASGKISRKTAVFTMLVFLALSVVFNYFACGRNIAPWIILLTYLLQNVLYSLKLKQIPVVDIIILVIGFLLRIYYGSEIIGVSVSNWLYLTVLAISFYLGLGKRRNEIVVSGEKESRSVLCFYSYDFLDKNMYVCSGLAIVFYSLWCVDAATIANFGSNKMIWTIPLIILICITYSHSAEKCEVDDPIDIIFKNKFILLLGLIYGASVIGIIYFLGAK